MVLITVIKTPTHPSAKCHECIYLFPGPQWLTTAARRHEQGGDAGSHLWIHGKSLSHYWLSTPLSSLAFDRNLNLWCDFNVDIHQIFMQNIIGAWLYPFLVSQRFPWDVPRVWHSATVKKCMRLDNIPLSPNTCYSVWSWDGLNRGLFGETPSQNVALNIPLSDVSSVGCTAPDLQLWILMPYHSE